MDEAAACASIAQAHAADAANKISRTTFNWNKAGFVAIILTLAFTGWAAKAAADSARTGERALRDVERAFVFAEPLAEHVMVDTKGGIANWHIFVPWRNTGSTPALNCTTRTNALYIGKDRDPNSPWTYEGKLPTWWPFADDAPVESNEFFIGPQATMQAGPAEIPIAILRDVFTDKGFLFIYGWIKFSDIFGNRHETRFCLELSNLSSDPADPKNMPIRVYRHWLRFNTTDEQCEREDREMYAAMPLEIKNGLLAAGWQPRTGYG